MYVFRCSSKENRIVLSFYQVGICLENRDLFLCDYRLEVYNVETAIAVIADGGATLAVDTQHLRINLRVGSLYQFIGELSIQPNNEVHKLMCFNRYTS